MVKTLLTLLLAILTCAGVAQSFGAKQGRDDIVVREYAVLRDQGYAFKKVVSDTSLAFVANDSLRPSATNCYWIKLVAVNPGYYDGAFNFRVTPNLENTLYYWDTPAKKWVARRNGLTIASDKARGKGIVQLMLKGKSATTLFVKVDMGAARHFVSAVKPKILFEKATVTHSREAFLSTVWMVGLAVLFLFILNNLHVYYSFRDKTVLYFLIAQLGGIIYITAYRFFFPTLFFCPPLNYQFMADGFVFFYNYNDLLMHFSVVLILYGFVQLTRTYLSTAKTMPHLDVFLQYGLGVYIIATVIAALINIFIFYVNTYSLLLENLLAFLLIVAIIGGSIAAYKRKLPDARTFLLANIFPLIFMLGMSAYHLLVTIHVSPTFLLPDVVIISQAVCFSVAIVARIRAMRNGLHSKELEAQQLVFEIQEMELERQSIELENQQINSEIREMALQQKLMGVENEQMNENFEAEKNRNKTLQEQLEFNQRELASATLFMAQKNELLSALKSQMQDLSKSNPGLKPMELQGINSILQGSQYLDANWAKFKLHFEQVHPDFFEELKANYPTLTQKETRLYAYFHINLSAKEIAALLNIDSTSVHRAKTRLYKKIAETKSGIPDGSDN